MTSFCPNYPCSLIGQSVDHVIKYSALIGWDCHTHIWQSTQLNKAIIFRLFSDNGPTSTGFNCLQISSDQQWVRLGRGLIMKSLSKSSFFKTSSCSIVSWHCLFIIESPPSSSIFCRVSCNLHILQLFNTKQSWEEFEFHILTWNPLFCHVLADSEN